MCVVEQCAFVVAARGMHDVLLVLLLPLPVLELLLLLLIVLERMMFISLLLLRRRFCC